MSAAGPLTTERTERLKRRRELDDAPSARPAKRPRRAQPTGSTAAPTEPSDDIVGRLNALISGTARISQHRSELRACLQAAGACRSALCGQLTTTASQWQFLRQLEAKRRWSANRPRRAHLQGLLPCRCAPDEPCTWRPPPIVAKPTVRPARARVGAPSAADLPQRLLVRIVRAVGSRAAPLLALAGVAGAFAAATLCSLEQMFVDQPLRPANEMSAQMAQALEGALAPWRARAATTPRVLRPRPTDALELLRSMTERGLMDWRSVQRPFGAAPARDADGTPSPHSQRFMVHAMRRFREFCSSLGLRMGVPDTPMALFRWVCFLESYNAELFDAITQKYVRQHPLMGLVLGERYHTPLVIMLKAQPSNAAELYCRLDDHLSCITRALGELLAAKLVPLEVMDGPIELFAELRFNEPLDLAAVERRTYEVYHRKAEPFAYRRSVFAVSTISSVDVAGSPPGSVSRSLACISAAERSFEGRLVLKALYAAIERAALPSVAAERLWPAFESALYACRTPKAPSATGS